MGLLEREINELRQMNQDVITNKIDAETVHARLGIYSQVEKRAKMILQAYVLSAKHGVRVLKGINASNLIGNLEAINTNIDSELEMVKCPDQDNKLIARAECLDYSGSTEHNEGCQKCDQYKITRDRLLPK